MKVIGTKACTIVQKKKVLRPRQIGICLMYMVLRSFCTSEFSQRGLLMTWRRMPRQYFTVLIRRESISYEKSRWKMQVIGTKGSHRRRFSERYNFSSTVICLIHMTLWYVSKLDFSENSLIQVVTPDRENENQTSLSLLSLIYSTRT